jgi:hypothetical protein
MAANHEARNMRLLSHTDVGGFGTLGEGIGLHAGKGRRVLFVAHESAPKNFTGIDVTDPRRPEVVCQTALPHEKVRSNSLSIMGDVMAVAYQTLEPGLRPAGFELFDISDPTAPRSLSVFDTSGPHSRGAHFVWLDVDGFAYIASGMPDWEPNRPKDHQLVVIVDVRDPKKPKEIGRWWLPGTKKGDKESLAVQPDPLNDLGHRAHNINVYPERPDRAYVAYLDGGVLILDISDRAHPTMISRFDYHPPMKAGFTHTVVPLFERGLLIVSDEANERRPQVPESYKGAGWDHPKLVWIMDARHEPNVFPLSTLPMPQLDEFRYRGGRFGAHNVHENDPVPTAFKSDELVFATFFNAGVRVYDIRNQLRPEEVAFFIPAERPGSKHPAPDVNDVYVDENRVIYAVDRSGGGLYILDMTV